MNSNNEPGSSGRRIYNVGAHGSGLLGQLGNSFNNRLLEGFDLNDSMGDRKFDQRFDASQDEYSSSRPHYNNNDTNSMTQQHQNLRRSGTGELKGAALVHFAETAGRPRNHPLQNK